MEYFNSAVTLFQGNTHILFPPEFDIKYLSNQKEKSLNRQDHLCTIPHSKVLTAALPPDLPYALYGISPPFFSTSPAPPSQTSPTEFTFLL